MADDTKPATDQASAASTTPQVGNATTTTSAPPAGTDQQQTPTLSLEDAQAALKKARDEAASYRVKLREFELAQKAAEDAKLSEQERLAKQLAELQARESQATTQAQERIVRAEVRAAAAQVGINPALAARLVDYSEIEYDESGEPTNIEKLLAKAVKEFGLVAQSRPATSGGATNPGRAAGNGSLTLDIIKTMPMRERMARIDEITAWEKAQRQTK